MAVQRSNCMNCRTKEYRAGIFYKVGRKRGRRKCKQHRISVTCNLEKKKSPAQEPGDEGVSCLEITMAYERVVAAGRGRPRMTVSLYTRALSTVPYSPNNTSSQLRLPTALLAQDHICPCHLLKSLEGPPGM